jgi:hypothetical protein
VSFAVDAIEGFRPVEGDKEDVRRWVGQHGAFDVRWDFGELRGPIDWGHGVSGWFGVVEAV